MFYLFILRDEVLSNRQLNKNNNDLMIVIKVNDIY